MSDCAPVQMRGAADSASRRFSRSNNFATAVTSTFDGDQNPDTCPTGITTQNPTRFKALDVELKSVRVANYHASMVKHLMELVAAAGLVSTAELKPEHIHRRIDHATVKTYAELYPGIDSRALLDTATVPPAWRRDWEMANPERW